MWRQVSVSGVARFSALLVALATSSSQAQTAAPQPGGPIYHFSDCQDGAAEGCVPGDNLNPGTAAEPKRTLAGMNLNALPAGTRLLFARGGVWAGFTMSIENQQVTPDRPLVFDAYGTGPAPWLKTATGNAVNLGGRWGNTTNDGGYMLRNLKLDGMGTAAWGLWLVQNVRHVTLDKVEVTGFEIGIHSSNGRPHGVTALTVRESRISRNSAMGMLGAYSESVIENSLFEGNNFSGSPMNHAIYLGGGNGNVIRANQFIANSTVNGVCQGGNVTVHGLVDGLLIEGNTIRQQSATFSCYGFAVTTGYTTYEEFKNVVIRGNTVVNTGMTAIAANAAPGILVENNRVTNSQPTQQYSIWIPANGGAGAGDGADRDAVVRNNTVCLVHAQGSVPIFARVPGAQVSNNTVVLGPQALRC